MKFKINIPNDVSEILDKLNNAGCKAYVVGGCVRDTILNKTPNDWDICTNALPDKIIEVFKEYEVIPTGLQHGTVTVVLNHNPYEVTTFRHDGQYSDFRHPDEVEFTTDLIEDLSRRDFTINAMAYNPQEGLIDPFSGMADIENKFIKCVGDPFNRFSEDALRVLRAIRFSCQLEFTIDPATALAIRKMYHRLDFISTERITAELNKMIVCSSFYQNFIDMPEVFSHIIPGLNATVGFHQLNPHHIYTVYDHTAYAISYSQKDLIIKLALLFHDIGKPKCVTYDSEGVAHYYGHGAISSEIADKVMRAMKYDNNTREKVVELVKYHDATIEPKYKYIRRWLNRLGEEQFRRLLNIRVADIMAQKRILNDERLYKVALALKLTDEILTAEECFTLKDLAINGKDLLSLGIPEGKEIGRILNQLLDMVMDDEIENDKDELLKFVNNL